MKIRPAEEKDIEKILDLLSQVLELHAAYRPDLFIPGTTKYSREELIRMISEENRRIFVAVDENDEVNGYAFCEIRKSSPRANMVPHTSLYVNDLCVDEKVREHHIGKELMEHVFREASALGCYEISLTVWEDNTDARKFYDHMGFSPKSTTMEYIL